MRVATRALQCATLAAPALENGQDSVKKLAFAPLGFLSLGGNSSYIASIIASAVSFLEGYSAEDLETDIRLEQNASGDFVAHTELKLVPYAHSRQQSQPTALSTPVVHHQRAAEIPALAHRFSISRTVPVKPAKVSAETELERFKNCFRENTLMADLIANEILLSTDSVEVANAVLRYSAQIGLTIPKTTLTELMARMNSQERSVARAVFRNFEFEMNLGVNSDASLFCTPPANLALASTNKRRRSKLERLRSAPAPKSKL